MSFSPFPEAAEPEVRALAGLRLEGTHFLARKQPRIAVSSQSGSGEESSVGFFYKGTDSTCKGPTSWPPHLPKPPSPSTKKRMRFELVSLGEIQPVSL